MPENLTPEHMRCASGTCPSVHQLEDGRYLIVGTSADYIGRRASIEDENRIQDYGPGNSYADDQIVWQAYRSPEIAIGPGETGIVISPDLLSSLPELVRLREENKRLREALEFYGDPETYHAIAFFADSPCGGFIDDFDEDHGHPDYGRPMPGKLARSALSSDGGEG